VLLSVRIELLYALRIKYHLPFKSIGLCEIKIMPSLPGLMYIVNHIFQDVDEKDR
jgi:hypothetical protein